jgi:type I restriction enzyme R subunit
MVVRTYGLLEEEFDTTIDLPAEVRRDILVVAEHVVDETAAHARLVNFWQNRLAQEDLRRRLMQLLDERDDLFPFETQAAIADRLLELARANRALLAAREQA